MKKGWNKIRYFSDSRSSGEKSHRQKK